MDNINTEDIDLKIKEYESSLKKHYDDVKKVSDLKDEIKKSQNKLSESDDLYELCEQEIKIVSAAMLCNIVALDNFVILRHLMYCNSQWEVTFYAKKLCSISYEFIQTTSNQNQFLHQLSEKYDLCSMHKSYTSLRKNFMNAYEHDTKWIRNKAESHIDPDFQEYYKFHNSIYKIDIEQMAINLYKVIDKLKNLVELIDKHLLTKLSQG